MPEPHTDALYVIDNFLSDPDALRQLALKADYPSLQPQPFFPGRNSAQRFPIEGLDARIARIVGHPVQTPPGTSHTKFRLSLGGERGAAGVHIDNCHWTGVLCLSRDKDGESGTDFFRHIPSNTVRAPVYPEDWADWSFTDPQSLWDEVLTPHTNDESKWALLRRVPMKFNRLILFEPWQWHNAGPGFGDSVENGRLIYLLSYNRAT